MEHMLLCCNLVSSLLEEYATRERDKLYLITVLACINNLISHTHMTSSSTSSSTSIIDYRRAFNVDIGSITEYFSTVLASNGELNRGALRNGNLLFQDYFLHNIAISRQYFKLTITAKCRAQMKKSKTYEVIYFNNSKRVRTTLYKNFSHTVITIA